MDIERNLLLFVGLTDLYEVKETKIQNRSGKQSFRNSI